MSKIRLTTKKMLVGILVTSLVMSISVSESYAEDVIDNTEITENEEQVKADIPADIILSDKEYVLNSDAVEIDGTTSVTDGGILTYQWYKDGEIMENEVDSKIIPDTSVLGEHRYKVIAKMINGEVPEEDEDLIKEGTSALKYQVDGLTIGDYLDISVSKKIGDNDWSKLTDLQKRLKIVLTLPTGISQKDGDKYIIRLHDGEYVLVKDMDEDDKTFTFSTKYFSTYALAFVSSTSDKKESKNVIEKKHTVAWTIGSISTIILIGLIVYFVIRKKKRYFR